MSDEPVNKKKKQSNITSFFIPSVHESKSSAPEAVISNCTTTFTVPISSPTVSATITTVLTTTGTSVVTSHSHAMTSTSAVYNKCPDIAEALNLRLENKLSREERLRFISDTLKVDPGYKFPFTEVSSRKYYVGLKHISGENECFYFSPSLQGLLCLPCVLFAPEKAGRGNVQSIGRLVTEPLLKFNKLTGKDSYLTTHRNRKYHEDGLQDMEELRISGQSTTILEKLNTKHAEEIATNKAILRAIIHEIETCGRTNIALRGHRDSGLIDIAIDNEHINYKQGNLRALIQKAALRDPILSDHLMHGPKNASYISPETQNHLITSIATVMLQDISNEIKAAKFYSIGADETGDISKREQMVLTIRFVDSNKEIRESFVGFVEVVETTGQALSEVIIEHIEKLGLQKNDMVGQAYDGASAMSGIYKGTQTLIRTKCPNAIYVHCSSHCLNLAISKSVNIPEVRQTITTIQDSCSYFKHSAQRVHAMKEAVEKLCPNSRHARLKQYCATRWVGIYYIIRIIIMFTSKHITFIYTRLKHTNQFLFFLNYTIHYWMFLLTERRGPLSTQSLIRHFWSRL